MEKLDFSKREKFLLYTNLIILFIILTTLIWPLRAFSTRDESRADFYPKFLLCVPFAIAIVSTIIISNRASAFIKSLLGKICLLLGILVSVGNFFFICEMIEDFYHSSFSMCCISWSVLPLVCSLYGLSAWAIMSGKVNWRLRYLPLSLGLGVLILYDLILLLLSFTKN